MSLRLLLPMAVLAAFAPGQSAEQRALAAREPRPPVRNSNAAHARVVPRDAEIEAHIKDILSAQEYNRSFDKRKGLWDTAAEFAVRKVTEFFRWLLDSLGFGGVSRRVSRVLAWTVIALFALAAAVVAVRLSARLRPGLVNDGAHSAAYEMPSSAKMLAEAAELAGSGDYRSAFLKTYLACLAYLDEAEAVRFARSRTNWEYLRELRGKGLDAVADDLRPLTIEFDRKFYGREGCARTDYDSALAVYDQVRQRLAA